ncbi:MAG: hypothetical protein NZ560_04155 [Aquificaceae bacterium]|nr:hypothetical protein [Aquificaceae bacterium]MDW8096789.1 hypothetical protein [Aquificaceae bacterium]
MKALLGALVLLLVAGLSGTVVFLNPQKVKLVLTPVVRGVYYHLPEVGLGFLVSLSFFSGLVAGYLLALLARALKG